MASAPEAIDIDAEDDATMDACRASMRKLFPDMCPRYLENTAAAHRFCQAEAVNYVLNLADVGKTYDKKPNSLKRKRANSEAQPLEDTHAELAALRIKYSDPIPVRNPPASQKQYIDIARKIMAQEFPRVRVEDIRTLLWDHQLMLFPAYLELEDIVATWKHEGDSRTRFKMKKNSGRATISRYLPSAIEPTIRDTQDLIKKQVLEELQVARRVVAPIAAKREADIDEKHREEENFAEAQKDGTVAECECCFGDYAMNRMVHCDSDRKHSFCIECARRNAETAIGLSRSDVKCMSTDNCEAGFSHSQRMRFLDHKLTQALDCIATEASLRTAGIENLEKCPFCPYAAECSLTPQEDKEFRCGHPDCGIVSCRLCREETHIPKSCEEVARDKGVSARRRIEEAMSDALIRKCNQCKAPFVKEAGCNKMRCTNCGNMQCYVCSKTCTYDHFDDKNRGGKYGNCPLFDSQERRHDEDVRRAEEAARKTVAEDHPEVGEDLLKINMSDRVVRDDQDRRNRDRMYNPAGVEPPLPPVERENHIFQEAAVPGWQPEISFRELASHPAQERRMLQTQLLRGALTWVRQAARNGGQPGNRAAGEHGQPLNGQREGNEESRQGEQAAEAVRRVPGRDESFAARPERQLHGRQQAGENQLDRRHGPQRDEGAKSDRQALGGEHARPVAHQHVNMRPSRDPAADPGRLEVPEKKRKALRVPVGLPPHAPMGVNQEHQHQPQGNQAPRQGGPAANPAAAEHRKQGRERLRQRIEQEVRGLELARERLTALGADPGILNQHKISITEARAENALYDVQTAQFRQQMGFGRNLPVPAVPPPLQLPGHQPYGRPVHPEDIDHRVRAPVQPGAPLGGIPGVNRSNPVMPPRCATAPSPIPQPPAPELLLPQWFSHQLPANIPWALPGRSPAGGQRGGNHGQTQQQRRKQPVHGHQDDNID